MLVYISSIWIEPEGRDTAVEEGNRLKDEINNIQPYEWKIKIPEDHRTDYHENNEELSFKIIFKIFFSMIDSAFLSYMTGNITDQRCSFCHKLPRYLLTTYRVYHIELVQTKWL